MCITQFHIGGNWSERMLAIVIWSHWQPGNIFVTHIKKIFLCLNTYVWKPDSGSSRREVKFARGTLPFYNFSVRLSFTFPMYLKKKKEKINLCFGQPSHEYIASQICEINCTFYKCAFLTPFPLLRNNGTVSFSLSLLRRNKMERWFNTRIYAIQ